MPEIPSQVGVYFSFGSALFSGGTFVLMWRIGRAWGRAEQRHENLTARVDELGETVESERSRLNGVSDHVGKIRGALGMNGH